MPPKNEPQTSKNLRALMDLGYIMERVEDRRGITLRGRRGVLLLSVTEPSDERAAAALLEAAQAREAPVR